MSQVQSLVVAADTRGKHRIVAELKRLEQEARFLEEARAYTVKHVMVVCRVMRADEPNLYMSRLLHFHGKREELEKLEKSENASACCKELLTNVETGPDPLLPITSGPQNPAWDRWFEGPQNKKGCGCWIL